MSALVPISSTQMQLAAAWAPRPARPLPPWRDDGPRVSQPRYSWRPQAPAAALDAVDAYTGRTGTPPPLLLDTYA